MVALGFGSQLGAEFFPPSDEGRFFVEFETPPGTSVQGTLEVLQKNEEWILRAARGRGPVLRGGHRTHGQHSRSRPTA